MVEQENSYFDKEVTAYPLDEEQDYQEEMQGEGHVSDERFVEEVEEELKKRGSGKKVYSSFWHNILISLLIITIILGISGFLYLSYKDKYKSNFDFVCDPPECPACPEAPECINTCDLVCPEAAICPECPECSPTLICSEEDLYS